MEQEIFEKMEDMLFEIKENREEIRNVEIAIECFFLCALVVGLAVGRGMTLTNALWIMMGFGIIFYVVLPIHRKNKRAKKSRG